MYDLKSLFHLQKMLNFWLKYSQFLPICLCSTLQRTKYFKFREVSLNRNKSNLFLKFKIDFYFKYNNSICIWQKIIIRINTNSVVVGENFNDYVFFMQLCHLENGKWGISPLSRKRAKVFHKGFLNIGFQSENLHISIVKTHGTVRAASTRTEKSISLPTTCLSFLLS